VIATAHKETINQAVGNLQRRRNEVLAIRGLEVSKPVEQVKLPDYVSYKIARELYRQHSKTDTVCWSKNVGAQSRIFRSSKTIRN